jgi:FkbM family methyltransferase
MKSVVVKILKNITPPVIFKIYRILNKKKYYIADGQYYALDGIDIKLKKYLNYDNGFYIEVGANDGIKQSNTFYLEKEKNWRGVLVEPSPNNYILCKHNRSNSNNVYCNACVSFNYKEKFVEMAYSDLVSTALNLESDTSNPLLQAQSGLPSFGKDEIPVYGAIAKTMNALLIDSHSPREIDFFSLDVEGAEIEVLKGIDYNKYKFKFILVESRDITRIETFLKNYNYRLIEKLSHHDYLFEFSW